ncbi:methyl-accepting chemotaxis protein, partial [Vibrio harveyi]
MAMANATLTRNVLEQVKLLNYGMQITDPNELPLITSQIEELASQSDDLIEQTSGVADHLSSMLQGNVAELHQITNSILSKQSAVIQMQSDINSAVGGFRYGLSSIGPEMNRISSFLSNENPESSDAANRFIASASSMESTFLVMMMQTELGKAEREYKEMRNRIAGINLAFDDFKEWHPEVNEFASLIAPYEMVQAGFKDDGVLRLILAKLERSEQQKAEFQRASQLSNETMYLLDQVSDAASALIKERETVVQKTIKNVIFMVVTAAGVISLVILATWFGLR